MKYLLPMLILVVMGCKKETSNTSSTAFCHPKEITGYDASGNVTNKMVYHFSNGRLDSVTSYTSASVYAGVVKYEYSGNSRWATNYNTAGQVIGKSKEILDNGYVIEFQAYNPSGTVLQSKSIYTYNCPN